MANVATRLISLIMLLQSRPLWKAAELAEELNVSERTIHRYMGMLDELGIPIYTERGPYGGFSLLRGYRLPPLIFTAEEATVLYLGASLVNQISGHVYQDAVTGAIAKLDNVLPDELLREVALAQRSLVVSDLAAKDYRPWSAILQTLGKCIRSRQAMSLTYRSFDLEETCREVDPYALTFRWGFWYLICFCHLRDDMRTFRVDRIQAVEGVARSFEVPADFSAQAFVEDAMRFEPRYTVVVHLDAHIALQVREHMDNWTKFIDQPDGSATLHMEVSNLHWAAGWVLSHGGAAVALAPQEFVDRVRAGAQRILNNCPNAAGAFQSVSE